MTVRQYIHQATVELVTTCLNMDEKLISAAESNIDTLATEIMDHKYSGNLKSFVNDLEFPANQAVFGVNTLTLPSQSYPANHFQFTVVELLQDSGATKKGTKLAVQSSAGSVLNLDPSGGATEAISSPVKIHQIGVFPRQVDQGNYGKTVPHQLLEAVAWQAAYLQAQGCDVKEAVQNADEKGKKKSESIGTTYSYTLADGTGSKSSVCEKAANLLASIL